MLDIGWQELFIVAAVTLIVVGPEEIPKVLRTVSAVIRKLRSMAQEFQSGLDEMVREVDLADIKKKSGYEPLSHVEAELRSAMNPDGSFDFSKTSMSPLDPEEEGFDPNDTAEQTSGKQASGKRASGSNPRGSAGPTADPVTEPVMEPATGPIPPSAPPSGLDSASSPLDSPATDPASAGNRPASPAGTPE